MESITYLKNIKIPPKKLRFYVPTVKKHKPSQVLAQLRYASNRPSQILYQSIKSAIYNAKNALNIDESLLQFKTLTIEEGQKLKRYKAGGRGTAKPIKHRYSHIKIVLIAEEKKDPKPVVEKVKEQTETITTEVANETEVVNKKDKPTRKRAGEAKKVVKSKKLKETKK